MTFVRRATPVLLVLTLLLPLAGGCATTRKAYYNAWEKFGYAKRERLVDNVKAARQEQVDAKKEFATALEQFKSVANFKGGDLEAVYNKLNKEYQRCESQAGEVRDKIQSVKNVSQALFEEWEGEVHQIKDDPSLQKQSRELLDRTRSNYKEMIDKMDAAAATMDPVLSKFKNRVLFLKSNLNAQAIASL
jgi:Skp family chaperone for outer membrane proteins